MHLSVIMNEASARKLIGAIHSLSQDKSNHYSFLSHSERLIARTLAIEVTESDISVFERNKIFSWMNRLYVANQIAFKFGNYVRDKSFEELSSNAAPIDIQMSPCMLYKELRRFKDELFYEDGRTFANACDLNRLNELLEFLTDGIADRWCNQ